MQSEENVHAHAFLEIVNLLNILNGLQEVQRDIEKHSTGVASVLNLCEVLLHDCDACSTETGCDSIQQSTRGLERRWRNICAMSMERRLKSVTFTQLILGDYCYISKLTATCKVTFYMF